MNLKKAVGGEGKSSGEKIIYREREVSSCPAAMELFVLLFPPFLQWEIRVNSTLRNSVRGPARSMEWRRSSKPVSCLTGSLGSLFSKDSWVERSKIKQERDSVAGAWEERSWESWELIPAPPLAACGILGKSPACLLVCSPSPVQRTNPALSFIGRLGVAECVVRAPLHSSPSAMDLQVPTCAGALHCINELLDHGPLRGGRGHS